MSIRLSSLRREIATLRKQFLPDPFDPLGTYVDSERVQSHTRAFLVLSHAAIESFLEEWAKEIARTAEVVWAKSSRVAMPLAFLLGSLGDRFPLTDSISNVGAKDCHQRLAEVVKKLFVLYYKRIKDNHGIKEKNLLSLFEPLGIPSTAFTSTLLPNLDTLGAIRGVHAHYSARAVSTPLDPETEYKRIQSLLADLIGFDQWLSTYKQKIR